MELRSEKIKVKFSDKMSADIERNGEEECLLQ